MYTWMVKNQNRYKLYRKRSHYTWLFDEDFRFDLVYDLEVISESINFLVYGGFERVWWRIWNQISKICVFRSRRLFVVSWILSSVQKIFKEDGSLCHKTGVLYYYTKVIIKGLYFCTALIWICFTYELNGKIITYVLTFKPLKIITEKTDH